MPDWKFNFEDGMTNSILSHDSEKNNLKNIKKTDEAKDFGDDSDNDRKKISLYDLVENIDDMSEAAINI